MTRYTRAGAYLIAFGRAKEDEITFIRTADRSRFAVCIEHDGELWGAVATMRHPAGNWNAAALRNWYANVVDQAADIADTILRGVGDRFDLAAVTSVRAG